MLPRTLALIGLGGLAMAMTTLLAVPTPILAAHELEGRDIEAGRETYLAQCAACHGANLQGQANWRVPNPDGTLPAPPHDETGHTWHHDTQLLFDYTKQGGAAALAQRGVTGFNSGMPGHGDRLSDDEIWEVLAYIRSTWPARVQASQAARNPPH